MTIPRITFSEDTLSQFEESIKNEWLITNGLGGYASSTVLGLNTRKYHALLVAALRPPGERTVILSKLDEDVNVGGKVYQLGANDFGQDIYPQGYKFLKSFSVSPFPTYIYSAGDTEVKKTVFLLNEKNCSVAFYEFVNKSMDNDSTIQIYPLISFRNFNYVINRNESPLWLNQTQKDNEVELTYNNPSAAVILRAVGGTFASNAIWINGILYREEQNRGEASRDESYQPGRFEFKIPKNSAVKFAIVATVNDNHEEALKTLDDIGSNVSDIENALDWEVKRRESNLAGFYNSHSQIQGNDELSWLFQAANDFIVKGTNNRRFIIAGYQWFGSWGRDSFVSLPGLMLTTGRFKEAKDVILDFTRYCKRGLIPNLIDDKTGEPLYNTVDGTLWYVNSILQYLKYTGDYEFLKNLWPILNDIIENHRMGTMNDIRVDSDGLLAHGPQLTWMDAVVNGVPVTPRSGKAVEVQALWYNTLRTLQFLAEKFDEKHIADDYSHMAEKAKLSFNEKFWDPEKNYLCDVIDEYGHPDFSVRPNQIIAGALDFKLIDNEKANHVVDFVQAELLTHVGLRTLSPKDPRYKAKYEGGRESRDNAYHSGTIWPWLTGPFTTAYLKAKGYSDYNLKFASEKFIMPLLSEQITRGGLGSISEICDGDPPHLPRGCIAQAWSVAEPLRAYIEDVLKIRPKFENDVLFNLKPLTQYA
jgi:predicted glycogen debranching enzyme